jgi:hypothetical protein
MRAIFMILLYGYADVVSFTESLMIFKDGSHNTGYRLYDMIRTDVFYGKTDDVLKLSHWFDMAAEPYIYGICTQIQGVSGYHGCYLIYTFPERCPFSDYRTVLQHEYLIFVHNLKYQIHKQSAGVADNMEFK